MQPMLVDGPTSLAVSMRNEENVEKLHWLVEIMCDPLSPRTCSSTALGAWGCQPPAPVAHCAQGGAHRQACPLGNPVLGVRWR